MSNQDENHSTEVTDVKQYGLFAALASLSYVFWVVGGMEMVERLAYYGVRTVAGLYATDPKSAGGLGLPAAALGTIFLWWAMPPSCPNPSRNRLIMRLTWALVWLKTLNEL